MNSLFVGFPSKMNVGAIIDRPFSAFIIRGWRAVIDRPYKQVLEIHHFAALQLKLQFVSDKGNEF